MTNQANTDLRSVPELDDLQGYPSWMSVVKTYALCQKLLSTKLGHLGLSLAQYEVLLAVYREEAVSQKRLASRLLVTKSNVTAMLERMEREGWVTRTPHPDDARSRCVSTTRLGRDLLKRGVEAQAAVVRIMTGELSAAQMEAIREVMRTVGRDLERALEAP
ncbi:MAG: MarR family transcriptional regulator [Myxococcota bacterium]